MVRRRLERRRPRLSPRRRVAFAVRQGVKEYPPRLLDEAVGQARADHRDDDADQRRRIHRPYAAQRQDVVAIHRDGWRLPTPPRPPAAGRPPPPIGREAPCPSAPASQVTPATIASR